MPGHPTSGLPSRRGPKPHAPSVITILPAPGGKIVVAVIGWLADMPSTFADKDDAFRFATGLAAMSGFHLMWNMSSVPEIWEARR